LKPTTKNIYSIILIAGLAFFSWLMLRIVLLYIPIRYDVAFLQLKQASIHIDIWRIAFFTHVFTSMAALVAGFTQFSKAILKKRPKLHRTMGYIYVIDILFVTGPSGLIMSYYANGGISSKIAFTILSVLWITFTAIALNKAIKGNFVAHKKFMIRSYALTLSALSLRGWKVLIAQFTHIPPMDRYRIIAWLGWGLNLIIAEIIILQQIKKKRALKNNALAKREISLSKI
jgi:uncharacterized membrane protein